MDPRLLSYYERELSFIRESAAEFAQRYKKVARRLSLEGISEANECPDPYVERLLEGFAFLAARVQLKIDSRYPELTHHLLEMVNPNFLAPTPSCTVVELLPDLSSGTLLAGVRVPRGSALHAARPAALRTDCEYRTAHDVTLWPLEVVEAAYLPSRGAAAALGAAGHDDRVRAGIRLRLKTPGGIPLASLPVEHLDFFINATDSLAGRIHEAVLANGVGVAGVDGGKGAVFGATIHALGFDDNEALLPDTGRNSSAHRLLQEYFALPQRFLFFRVAGLGPAMRAASGDALDLVILLDRADAALEGRLKQDQFRLHSTPAVNLFPRSLDRLRLDAAQTEQRLLPDRNRSLDFEIYRVEAVHGLEPGVTKTVDVLPIYSTTHISGANPQQPFFVTQRRPNVVVSSDDQRNLRTHYIGTETYISVLGLGSAGQPKVVDLDIDALCTNRDLPLLLTLSGREDDFALQGAAPLRGVRALTRLTEPRLSPVFADSRKRPQTAWRFVSHLAANHLSLCDRDPTVGAELLREILTLYISLDDKIHEQQINGVRSVEYQPVFRRIPGEGPIAYGRGLAISVKLDDTAFEGAGILPLAGVLERFFSRYVSLNSFTQTSLTSVQRGEIKRWPARSGTVALV